MSQAWYENCICSHPCTDSAITGKKNAEKSHEKFNELIFSRQSSGLLCHLCKGGYKGNFHCKLVMHHLRKIASPVQAKNLLCSHGLKCKRIWNRPDDQVAFCTVVLLCSPGLVLHCTPLLFLSQGHNLEEGDLTQTRSAIEL